jgi:carboxymethylenebutenolidase
MASQFMALRSEVALADIAACVAELHRLGVTKVGVTGFCMGGRITYETATKTSNGAPLEVQAAAPFYGATIGKMLAEPHCPILCFFGGTDDYISPEEIAAVQAFHEGSVVVYPEAGHGFMRDGSDSYDEAAATDAWRKLLDFFAEHLR